jgi:hypothetical protein
VKKDEDGHYYLRSSDFDSLIDDGAVRERALELVEHMNWAAKFHFGDGYRPVEVDAIIQIDEEGNRRQHITLTSSLEARSRLSAELTVGKEGDVADSPHPPSEVESMVTLAERDDRVAASSMHPPFLSCTGRRSTDTLQSRSFSFRGYHKTCRTASSPSLRSTSTRP